MRKQLNKKGVNLMRKKFLIFASLLMILSSVANAAENESELLINGGFEEGISGYGISYSGRNDTALPKIFSSGIYTSEGEKSLEFVVGANLENKASSSPASMGFAYQGIHTSDSFNAKSGVEYKISGDIYTSKENIKMRFVVMENSKAVYASEEVDVAAGIWNTSVCLWTPEKECSNVKIRVVFYDISKGDKIYIDNLSVTQSPISNRMWQAESDALINITDEKVSFSADADAFGEGVGVMSSINKKLLGGNTAVLDGYITTDLDKAYIKVSSESNGEKYYIVNKDELTHIQFVINPEAVKSDNFEIRVEAFGTATQNTYTVDMYDFTIRDSGYIINIEETEAGELAASGVLKKGNENANISVSMTDNERFTTTTDENGEYSFTRSVVHGDTFKKTITVELSGLNGYPDTEGRISAEYLLVNDELINATALQADAESSASDVKAIVTEDLLDALGISMSDVYRKADKGIVITYLLDKDISDGVKLKNEILTAACISVLDANNVALSDVLDEYAEVLEFGTVATYKDLYNNTMSKEKLNSNFEALPNEIKNIDDLYKVVSYALVKTQVESEATNAAGMKILVDYSDDIDLDISKYNSISSSKKNVALNEFVKYVKTENDYTKLTDKLSECVENVEDADDKKGSSGGGGGGGFTVAGAVTGNNGVTNPIVTPPIGITPSATLPTETVKYSFIDLSDYGWAEESIYKLYEQGVINASDDKKFNPGRKITRAEFAKMVAVMFGITDYDDVEVYGDVTKDKWYYSYVMALSNSSIINGVSDNWFAAEENITRQDICVIIARLYNAQAEENSSFKDADTVSDYAKTAVGYMCENGYINGYDDNTFRPMNFATRAEVAKILGALK